MYEVDDVGEKGCFDDGRKVDERFWYVEGCVFVDECEVV